LPGDESRQQVAQARGVPHPGTPRVLGSQPPRAPWNRI